MFRVASLSWIVRSVAKYSNNTSLTSSGRSANVVFFWIISIVLVAAGIAAFVDMGTRRSRLGAMVI